MASSAVFKSIVFYFLELGIYRIRIPRFARNDGTFVIARVYTRGNP